LLVPKISNKNSEKRHKKMAWWRRQEASIMKIIKNEKGAKMI